jgi:hypothetical protein
MQSRIISLLFAWLTFPILAAIFRMFRKPRGDRIPTKRLFPPPCTPMKSAGILSLHSNLSDAPARTMVHDESVSFNGGSTIFFGTQDERQGSQVWDCGRIHFFDQMRLWFQDSGSGANRNNVLTFSEAFWQELKAHPIPVDCEVVRALANNPGCLDLYTWLSWRCFQAKGPERVPLFGPLGLTGQLGVQEYARERKFRERMKSWLDLVRLYWPECPASLAKNGAFLELNRGIAVTPRKTA